MNLRPFPTFIQLRAWQERALEEYHALSQKNFLAFITPGGGKTIFALRLAHDLLHDGAIRNVIVVVHTDHLRAQWLDVAELLSIPLEVQTYQQIASYPSNYTVTVAQRVLVVLDEIHHAADSQMWGDGVRFAFELAKRRLLLTGTPFRHDSKCIPFLRYVKGVAQADFSYGYGEALRDGIVRPVYFPVIGGEARWKIGDDEITRGFDERLSQKDAARRINTALKPNGLWIAQTIRAAHTRLLSLRESGHAHAGGLIVASDQAHAKSLARIVQKVTETTPVIATSSYKDATQRITEFRESDTHWIVAVRMISEGVDIPRLRVGIYATNVVTELFFRQWVGRYVRVIAGLDEQSSYLYIPADARLIEYARARAEERLHVLREQAEKREREYLQREANAVEPVEFVAVEATAEMGSVIVGDESFSAEELLEAERLKHALGLGHLPNEAVAKIMRAMRERAL